MTNRNIMQSFVLAVLLSFLAFWWLKPGYGEVSPKAYKIAQALYSVSQKKSEVHLAKVEQVYTQCKEDLSVVEQKWLTDIIEDARAGQWRAATTAARRLLNDQINR